MVCIAILFAGGSLVPAHAAEYFVSCQTGRDTYDGTSREKPFRTLAKAMSDVKAGDTVTVLPGVYFEQVRIDQKGTSDHPITIRADEKGRNRVIITGADQAIRQKQIVWQLVDSDLNMYAVSIGHNPRRVLYSGVDLQPYLSVDMLKNFINLKQGDGGPCPGPLHGFAYDSQDKKLYVRLHQSGKYGSLNPNDHIMAVGAPEGGGRGGREISHDRVYNIGIFGKGDAHIIIDGVTFETPGSTGVATEANDVTIRNCWFNGCRFGVTGFTENRKPQLTSNRITLENCDYHHFPAMDDMLESMIRVKRDQVTGDVQPPKFFYWGRKSYVIGAEYDYERGIIGWTGHDWTVRNCYIHDAFEGFSSWGVSWAHGLRIHDNIFYNIVDNAVEMENHAKRMEVFNNLFIDVFHPLSFQPLSSYPFPSRNSIHHNVFINQSELSLAWPKVQPQISTCVFKAGIKPSSNFIKRGREVPDQIDLPVEGIQIFNNTFLMPHADLFAPLYKIKINNVHVFGNVFAIGNQMANPLGFNVRDNIFAGAVMDDHVAASIKSYGVHVDHVGEIGLSLVDRLRVRMSMASTPLMTPETKTSNKPKPFAGAVKPGEIWPELRVGPYLTDVSVEIEKHQRLIRENAMLIP